MSDNTCPTHDDRMSEAPRHGADCPGTAEFPEDANIPLACDGCSAIAITCTNGMIPGLATGDYTEATHAIQARDDFAARSMPPEQYEKYLAAIKDAKCYGVSAQRTQPELVEAAEHVLSAVGYVSFTTAIDELRAALEATPQRPDGWESFADRIIAAWCKDDRAEFERLAGSDDPDSYPSRKRDGHPQRTISAEVEAALDDIERHVRGLPIAFKDWERAREKRLYAALATIRAELGSE